MKTQTKTRFRSRWISKYLSEKDLQEISETVREAEVGAGGDIVPMVVRRSSAVRHVPVILGLTFALLFVALEVLGLDGWYLSHVLPIFYWHWGFQVGFLVFLVAAAWGLSHLHPVQRMLTSDVDEVEQVEKRAQLEFFLHRLNNTKKHTAVLIFVSVMERRAVILADEGIAKKLPPETWGNLLNPMSKSLKKGDWKAGFQEAIRQTGALLKTHLPTGPSENANELSNNMIVKE
jgi:putative membrane protein